MEACRANLDQDGFEFFFGALLGNVGAVRLYLKKETGGYKQPPGPKHAWWLKLEDDNDFATIVGLRNSDVHDKTIVPHRREEQLHGHSMTATSGYLGVVIRQADGTEETRRLPTEPTPEPTQPEPTPVPTVEYFIDPGELSKQPDFMVDPNSGKPYPQKAGVLNHLIAKPLSTIAQDCLTTLNQLLAEAESNGYILRS
jgi:hypothetical protein